MTSPSAMQDHYPYQNETDLVEVRKGCRPRKPSTPL